MYNQIKDEKNEFNLIATILTSIGGVLTVIGCILMFLLRNMDVSELKCRVNGIQTPCPQYTGILLGSIPLMIGVVLLGVGIFVFMEPAIKKRQYIKYLKDKGML